MKADKGKLDSRFKCPYCQELFSNYGDWLKHVKGCKSPDLYFLLNYIVDLMRAFVKRAFEKEPVRWHSLIEDLASEKLAHALQKKTR